MPHLCINFQSAKLEITLDVLIAKILEQIPGAKITAEDWYANRRIEEERVIEWLRQNGNPMHFGDEILASVDRAAVICGPTKSITIPMGGNKSMNGRVSRELMLIYSDVVIDQTMADCLLAILRPLGVVKDFYISDLQGPRKSRDNESV